jgi:hypothetical protein
MYDWRIVNMAQEHCNDLLREAEQERLVRLARQNQPPRHRLKGSTLLHRAVRLGVHLAALGARLRHGHSASLADPLLPAAR